MILHDNFESTLTPVLRRRPLYKLRTGMLSAYERAALNNELNQARIATNRKDFLEHSDLPFTEDNGTDRVKPADLLNSLAKQMTEDFLLLTKQRSTNHFSGSVLGDRSDIFIGEKCVISTQTEIDVREGPVFIDNNCEITAFSSIKGPAFIGKHSHLQRCIFESSTAGVHSRLGGEIADSIIGDFSNKHHEGFLGHSIVGDWVNLGALTTTSDLKNNYGPIRLAYEEESFETGMIKLGSILGDFVKTSIGTMLNTGTIVDFGSCLFSGRKEKKYYPPLYWGGPSESKYQVEKFTDDVRKIMKRRQQAPDENLYQLINNL